MTQEEKELLLKDLCGRLPYKVIVRYKSMKGEGVTKLGYGNIGYVFEIGRGWWTECKPYLRPMSSMTEQEIGKYHELFWEQEKMAYFTFCSKVTDYLNSIHVDYRGLIPKGLALEAPEEMYKIEYH